MAAQGRHHQNAGRGKAVDPQYPGYQQGREGPQHVNLAVGKVDEPDDAVDQSIAQSDKGIDAAPGEAAEKKLYEKLDVHAVLRALRTGPPGRTPVLVPMTGVC